mmetsp:Transcript_21907/g.36200  ORF Transcript_21907/g.36200 Transcript_21907/m.36200 type:complete len:287 (+) Transcript_21907:70-930(+)
MSTVQSTTFEVTTVVVDNDPRDEDMAAGTVRTTGTARRRLKRKSKRCNECLAFIALQLSGLGLFCSVASTLFCRYFQVNGAENENMNNLGIWGVPRNDTSFFLACTAYPSDTPIDAYIRTARAMSVLAPIICIVGMAVSFFAEIGPPVLQERRLLMSIFLILGAASMQGLTLMTLESEVCTNNPNVPGDGSCGLAFGAKLSIASCFFMSAGLFGLLLTGRKEIEFDTNSPSYNETGEQSIAPSDRNARGASEDDDDTNPGTPTEEEIAIQHGTGRYKFVDIWGKMV